MSEVIAPQRQGVFVGEVQQIQVHPYFNEQMSEHPLSPAYADRLADLLPPDWHMHRQDVWLFARKTSIAARGDHPHALTQGFKIHVSAAPQYARRVLDVVVPVCVSHGTEFKIIGDPELHGFLNSKRQERGSSGKFMTVYPANEESFKDLIEIIHQRTRDEEVAGPRILSDRQYKDSKILFYRYGGFYSPQRVRIDGTHEFCLTSPAQEYVPDERLPYFRLPSWVSDPFQADHDEDEDEAMGTVLLNNRYLIDSAMGFSNSGGIYFGIDSQSQEAVFVKEARPLTNCWTVGDEVWDATTLLRREYGTLQRLTDMDCIPRPIDCFEEAEHTFLVEQRITALTLRQYWALNDVILAPYIRRPGRLAAWVDKFSSIAGSLIRMIQDIHERGVLLGDLSPENLLIDPRTMRMWLVDFESAVSQDDTKTVQHAALWGTPGFVNPTRLTRGRLVPEDDFYAAAMTLYSGLASVTALFTLAPGAQELFLDRFVSLGLPLSVKNVITSLSQGAVNQAITELERLPRS
ncbi:hypothetical protein ACFTWS_33420 [Streptomyces sp. NPDC057027]|uniref:class III lanthionine synthetase LanKC N-terminal domain-containing protein n=1 Tax=Streptomyces sp. NPDC057027 TaxID=3346004 RepID=UPI003624B228